MKKIVRQQDASINNYKYYSGKTFQYDYSRTDKWLIGLPVRIDLVNSVQNEPQVYSFQEFEYYTPVYPLYPAVIHSIKTNPGNNLGLVAEYTYNNLGLKTSSILSSPGFTPEISIAPVEPRTESFVYNAEYGFRFLTKTTNSLNHSSETTINPIYGTATELKDANGFINKHYYDSFGRLVKTIAYDGIQSSSVMRWANEHIDKCPDAIYYKWTCSSGKSPETVFYDRLGREVRIVTYNQEGQKVYIDNTYNHKGYIVTTTEPYIPGSTQVLITRTEYDELGRVKKVIAPGEIITNFGYGVRSELVTNHLGLTSSKNYNAVGWLQSSTDNDNKTVNFTYYSDGKLKTSQIANISGSIVHFEYDINRNTTKITDPSWGLIVNCYNPFNEQYYTKDGKNNKYGFIHDKLGRIIERINLNNPNDHESWDYDETGKLGALISQSNLTGHLVEYQYGQFNRVNAVSETIDGDRYLTKYEHDPFGRHKALTYPNGLKVHYLYDSYSGNLKQIKRGTDDSNIWSAVAYNATGQMTESRIGKYTMLKTYFYETNLLKSTTSQGVQSFEYAWDDLANMTDRYDHLHKINNMSLHEHFTYDNRSQLRDTYLNGLLASHIIYDNLGNITSKTTTGGFEYQSVGSPYRLTSIVPDQNIDPGYKLSQNITYTDFNKVASITGNGYELEIEYGLENQRISQSLSSVNQYGQTTLLLNKHFIGGLQEKIFYETGAEKTISYITSPEGLTAIEVKTGITSEWYTVFTDHLGSITTLIRESDGLKFELSYDAWGNRRDPATWTNYSRNLPDFITITDSDFITDRGFTGHEHLDMFGLINMNGRVYDPVASRFLSPDSFIQASELALNYNGYVYCLNNPLKYTDPTGEFFLGTVLTFVGDLLKTAFIDGGLDPTSKSARQNAWKDFDPTAQWSPTNKAWKIDIGGFKTDPNRTIIGRGLQLISRWTWELPQTVLGKEYSHIRNMTGNVDDVSYYGGATLVNKNDNSRDKWGLTLGPYINSKNMVADPYTDDMFRHEYGHTLQSRVVGSLYLTHVGFPSLIGGFLDYNVGINNHDGEWYETQANRMAERYFSNHNSGTLTALPWDDTRYPREYNPNCYWMFAHPPLPFMWWLFF